MVDIDNVKRIVKDLNKRDVELVAVTKTRSKEEILDLFNLGLRNFGENRVQELLKKEKILPKEIKWHLIGHLQTNKVKYLISFIEMIQSVDSLRLLDEIQKRAEQNERDIKILLQVKISKDETKYGFERFEVKEFFESKNYNNYKNIKFCGLMGMASLTNNEIQIKKEFGDLYKLFTEVKRKTKLTNFDKLSMGMSGDFETAIECGSNMVRLGSILFN